MLFSPLIFIKINNIIKQSLLSTFYYIDKYRSLELNIIYIEPYTEKLFILKHKAFKTWGEVHVLSLNRGYFMKIRDKKGISG
jgi:hypothetical protein